jgi:hypothetical protein
MMNKLIKPVGTLTLFCLLVILVSCRNTDSKTKPLPTAAEPKKTLSSKVEIVKTQNGFQLLVNSQPFFIKGAGGSLYMDKLAKAGGNSIRTWDSEPQALDEAYAKGLNVLFGLAIGLPREGFNYSDQTAVTEQFEEIRQTVLKFKDHPALLMWGVGNEVDGYASDEDRVFKETNRIAEMIKQIDGNHPVITVVAGTGLEEEGHQKLAEIKRYCPALDAVGINIYGKIKQIPRNAKVQGWDKPYIITEFGPRGWWEVNQTSWGLPIEETSTEKGKFYLEAYRYTIENNPACLGSYVFYWGDKQEKTHTWFGLFLPDGSPTSVVDTMSLAWTGKWPANRCPIIGHNKMQIRALDASASRPENIYKPDTRLSCTIDANDPDGDTLTIKWELRRDVSDDPNIGGDEEKSTPSIEGAVLSSDKNQAVIQLPAKPRNYRIFVYVYDDKGHAATANLPIACRK